VGALERIQTDLKKLEKVKYWQQNNLFQKIVKKN